MGKSRQNRANRGKKKKPVQMPLPKEQNLSAEEKLMLERLEGDERIMLIAAKKMAQNEAALLKPAHERMGPQIIELLSRIAKSRQGMYDFALKIHSELIAHGIDDTHGNAIARIRELARQRDEALGTTKEETDDGEDETEIMRSA